jgi:hypothetical protein
MKLKVKHSDDDLCLINNIWQMIAYIFRFCKMELFITLLLIILGTIAILNVSYSNGKIEIKPTTKIEVTK